MLAGIRYTLPLMISRLFWFLAPSATHFLRCWLSEAPARVWTITSMSSVGDCWAVSDSSLAFLASSSGESFLLSPKAELAASNSISTREPSFICFFIVVLFIVFPFWVLLNELQFHGQRLWLISVS